MAEKYFHIAREGEAEYVTDDHPYDPLAPGNWFMLFKKFVHRQRYISVSARAIFIVLARYVSTDIYKESKRIICWPGHDTIRYCTGIRSRSTIRRAVQELIDLGYIEHRIFAFPPIKNPHEINAQPTWIYTLGEVEDDAEFKRRARLTKLERAAQSRDIETRNA